MPKPEEKIRQALITHMIESLGYDKSLFCIEKSIDNLPHLQKKIPGKRRIDILYYAKDIHSNWDLYPLLLIECKAGTITKGAMEQVVGYNHYIQSYFLAIANENMVKVFREGIQIPFIPKCSELIDYAKEAFA